MTNEWATPRPLFDKLHEEFGFTLDPCATRENTKCERFYTKRENGLNQPWDGEVVFMNPPYGREIKAWMRKAYLESQKSATVICLVPARTDTEWWHEYAMKATEIRYLRGRVKFEGLKKATTHTPSAPFPSAVVIFKPKKGKQ